MLCDFCCLSKRIAAVRDCIQVLHLTTYMKKSESDRHTCLNTGKQDRCFINPLPSPKHAVVLLTCMYTYTSVRISFDGHMYTKDSSERMHGNSWACTHTWSTHMCSDFVGHARGLLVLARSWGYLSPSSPDLSFPHLLASWRPQKATGQNAS